MISRCPSCASEVADEARVCPSCRWDFSARRRLAPGEPAAARPVQRQEPRLPESIERLARPPLELVHFADTLHEAAAGTLGFGWASAVDRPEAAQAVAPRPKPKKKARKEPSAGRPRAGVAWILCAGVALAGLAASTWRLLPLETEEQALAPTKIAMSFPKNEAAVRVDAQSLLASPPKPQPLPAAPEPQKPVARAAVAIAAAPAAKPASQWKFSGRAYDLLTLHSVYMAQLTFKDAQGKTVGHAQTNSEGRFQISLPPSAGGYRLAVSHPDYRERYLDDVSPPIRLTNLKLREQLVKALPTNERWLGREDGAITRDLVLIPVVD